MIWNGDRYTISSGKEIPVLRLLGCALFEDLSRRRYSYSISILESYRWRLLGGESPWRFGLSDCCRNREHDGDNDSKEKLKQGWKKLEKWVVTMVYYGKYGETKKKW